jgi:hypothetical protein
LPFIQPIQQKIQPNATCIQPKSTNFQKRSPNQDYMSVERIYAWQKIIVPRLSASMYHWRDEADLQLLDCGRGTYNPGKNKLMSGGIP